MIDSRRKALRANFETDPNPRGTQITSASQTSNAIPVAKSVGLVGLGLMGTSLALRLIEHGYQVHVWNRTRDKAIAFFEQGALWSDNPFVQCDRVIVSLYSSDVVHEVLGQMQSAMRTGQIIVDTTTGDPEASERMATQWNTLGVSYLDAPISGSSEQTRKGEALVMVSGLQSAFDACQDLWPVLGKKTFYVGPSGGAARMKLVSNLVLGLNRAALAEGIAFAESMGMDPLATLQVLQESAAYSKVMDVKGKKMIVRDYTTQAKLSQHLKDVRIINASAKRNQVPLPLSLTHQRVLEQAEDDGLGERDNCSIIEVYRKRSHD
jgi:3-hydroxyisobutyrate dehydrogenase-like beta-hydroxyacid dehydrogenase